MKTMETMESIKTNKDFLFCIPLGLHYSVLRAKIGGDSGMKIKNFVFCFAFRSACTTLPFGRR